MKRRLIKSLIKSLLAMLNTQWLNGSPCEYGFIGNVDAFSYSNLASEEKQRPGITVKKILEEADRFKCCPIGNGVTVIDGEETREATVWDLHELRQSLTEFPKEPCTSDASSGVNESASTTETV